MSEVAQKTPWPGFGYTQVPGLANRHIARYLRSHRKSMRRFFWERGMLEMAERMENIRRSRQGMMAKNRMFQKVLDDYAKAVSASSGAPPAADTEAAPEVQAGAVVLPSEPVRGAVGDRGDAGAGVQDVASTDGANSGPVIEE